MYIMKKKKLDIELTINKLDTLDRLIDKYKFMNHHYTQP